MEVEMANFSMLGFQRTPAIEDPDLRISVQIDYVLQVSIHK